MFNHLDRKEPNNSSSSPDIKSRYTVFSPLSPFSIKDSNETEYLLPDWMLVEEEHSKSQTPNKYDFDWLQDNNITQNGPQAISDTPNTVDYPETLPSANKRQHDVSDGEKSQRESNNFNEVKQTFTNNQSKSDYTHTVAGKLVEVGNPTEILKNARNMSREGNLDEAIGNYMSLVKSAKKLKQVVDDLEKLIANPHVKQTPAMLQTLADAYTKTGKLAKALPLYRKALGR